MAVPGYYDAQASSVNAIEDVDFTGFTLGDFNYTHVPGTSDTSDSVAYIVISLASLAGQLGFYTDTGPASFQAYTGNWLSLTTGEIDDLVYRPDPNFHGVAEFDFYVSDEESDVGEVGIFSINVAATDDAATFTGSDLAGFLTEDAGSTNGDVDVYDIDSPQRVVVADLGGLYGDLVITRFGEWDYTLDGPQDWMVGGEDYVDTFTISAFDGTTEQITITITGQNDDPVAVDDSNSVTEDIDGTAAGNLLANDSDVDDASGDLFVGWVNGSGIGSSDTVGGSFGSLDITDDGAYTYNLDDNNFTVDALNEGETLVDTFSYTVSDGNSGWDTGELTITIWGHNDAPVAVDDSESVTEDIWGLGFGDVLSNDTDVDNDPSDLFVG
ncbi:MAG: hypothetical protein HY854_00005, partial [Burkholderiales bacterium]|nr:hypothetical protein [Burkholderiales bacterium]